jgi:very-short-patch-repair endonuclease
MPRTPNKKCCICGKDFYRRPKEIKDRNIFFCKEHQREAVLKYPELFPKQGLAVGNKWWKGKKLPYKTAPRRSVAYYDITCAGCGKKYQIPQGKKRWGVRAKFCNQECYRKHPPQGDTDIEKILEQWLIENNIKYEKHKKIFRTFPDFFIEPNICLYADGDYWHSINGRPEKDAKINNQLTEAGYVVIRIKGSEIYAGKRPQLR